MSTEKHDGGTAFPIALPIEVLAKMAEIEDGKYLEACGGMSLRAYAAIHLGVPDSGIGWLDTMIMESQRRAESSKS